MWSGGSQDRHYRKDTWKGVSLFLKRLKAKNESESIKTFNRVSLPTSSTVRRGAKMRAKSVGTCEASGKKGMWRIVVGRR
jgi:hypothetical protein